MPPWFADPNVGKFSNDLSLRPTEIETLAAWAEAKSPAGETKDAPPARPGVESWRNRKADLLLKMPQAGPPPARGEVEYTHENVSTNFNEGLWVQMGEDLS